MNNLQTKINGLKYGFELRFDILQVISQKLGNYTKMRFLKVF